MTKKNYLLYLLTALFLVSLLAHWGYGNREPFAIYYTKNGEQKSYAPSTDSAFAWKPEYTNKILIDKDWAVQPYKTISANGTSCTGGTIGSLIKSDKVKGQYDLPAGTKCIMVKNPATSTKI
jgi:hypothetical protein